MKTYHYSLAATLVAIVTIPAARADYSSTVMGLNPVAYYRLNETTPVPGDTATNLGTAGINGTAFYINDPFHQAPGALPGSTDTAVGLNGTSQRVATPFDSSINPTGPFTAEAWINPAVSDTGTYCPMSYWTEASAPVGRTGWLIYQTSGGWNLRTYNGINSTPIVSVTAGGTPVPSTWYHLAVVYDGSTVNLYVNGVPTGPQATTGYAPNIGGPFSIGARSDGNFWFTGYADEVALYTNALSADDIQAHYRNGTNASPSQTYQSLVLAKNPILYYRLDEPEPTLGTPVTAANLGNLGSGADGTYDAGAITGIAGPSFAGFGAGNTAMRISSLAGDVAIPAGQPINTDTFTITAWFKRSGLHLAGQALVFNRYVGSSATGLGFGYNGSPGVDQFNVHWNEGPSSWLTGLVPPNDIWCFGAAVYTPTNVTVYLDNLSTNLATALTAHDFSPAPIYIGLDSQPYPGFSGTIGDVALFDRALSPAEVQSLLSGSQMPGQILGITRTPPDPLFEGYNITMTAAVAGVPPLTNQWYKDNRLLTGETNTTFSIPSAAVGDSGSYTLVVSDTYGSSTSAVQHITVSAGPPLFLSQIITNATRAIGGRVVYSVVAGGSAPISYVWKRGTTPVPGGTNSVLVLSNLQLSDQGSYTVTLSNPYGVNTNSATGVVSVFTVTNFPFAGMYGNPLAYYRLNETSGTTALDIASGLNGTLNGPIVTGVPGPQPPTWEGFESTNTAFQFDGASTRVQLPPFNLQTNQLTIVAWINPAGSQSDQTGIVSTRNGNDIGGFFLNYNNNNALSYVWYNSSSWSTFQSGLVPVVGQWNFAALVIEPTVGTVYLDSGSGLQSSSYSGANQTVVWSNPNIGVDPGYNRFFSGSIDEVVVYDRSLSPAEIANLDLLGSVGPVAPRIVEQPSSQAVYAGQAATFDVGALGALPLAFQWQHAETNIPGATTPTLTIPSAYYTDAGNYIAVVTNSLGSSNSVTATLSVLAPPMFANLTNDLVLHLTFDGNYLDSSGRGNNATPQGIPGPTFVPGKLGQAVSLNTVSASSIFNYVTFGATLPDFAFGAADSFSVAFWVNFTSWQNDLPMIGNAVGSTYQPGWVFAQDQNKIELSLVNANGSATYIADPVAGSPIISDGLWHNIVGVVDRGSQTASVYVDGGLAGSFSIAGMDTLDTGTALTIGQNPNGNYAVDGAGSFDDVGIWRRALTPTEAQSIYMVGQQGRSFDTYGPVILSLRRAGNDLELVWQAGTLLSSTNGVNGTYNPVSGASAPYYRVTPGPMPTFYRVRF
jgi:hypothetical protein